MRVLELFSGTKSIGCAFEAIGWQVTSLDSDPQPTHHLRGHSGMGLRGPPARTLRPRLGEPRVHRVLSGVDATTPPAGGGRPPGAPNHRNHRIPPAAVVGHRKPSDWIAQNPQLHDRPALRCHNLLPARLLLSESDSRLASGTTYPRAPGRPACCKDRCCAAFHHGRHAETAQRLGSKKRAGQNWDQLYSIVLCTCSHVFYFRTLCTDMLHSKASCSNSGSSSWAWHFCIIFFFNFPLTHQLSIA